MIRRWSDYGTEDSRLKVSAGIAIILNRSKILLCHPSKSKWENTYSLPKGGVESGETLEDAALRETLEETSVVVRVDQISNRKDPILIKYMSKTGRNYKNVYVYIVYINNISQIGLESETIDRSKLQLKEIDWAGFLDKNEAESKIFHRMVGLLELMK